MCYIYDTNGIIVRTMKNRSVAEHIRVYQEIFGYLEKRGLRTVIHKMDNECTQELKNMIIGWHKFQFVLVLINDNVL